MDRYNEVKVLLKRWEQSFFTQHQRKPNKEDIHEAPEETKELYKEYRSLKQAKENSSSSSHANTGGEDAVSAETIKAQKEPDAWGSHLNRSALPASSPKLTSHDRDSLKTSSQYYGLKLKNNMATFGKERPISLKKPGRVPLNTLKDEQPASNNSAKTTISDTESSPFTPRRSLPCLGSAVSKVLHQNEPEEPFELFKPVKQPQSEPADAAPGCTSSGFSEGAECAENKGSTSNSPDVGASPECTGSPRLYQDVGGGNLGSGARPSPANRLGFINRKWLERCQVFGEMDSEERPGAGNKEIKVDVGQGESKKEEEILQNGREQEEELNEEMECLTRIKKGEKTQQNTGKGHDREEVKETCTKEEEGEQGTQKQSRSKSSPKPKSNTRRGKKRQREGEGEEGAEKKRKTKRKKEEEEGSEVSSGTEKKKRNKKNMKEEDGDEKKQDKGCKTELQENLLGEVEEEFGVSRRYRTQTVPTRVSKGAEGNFVKINLKKKSHVKGYALRGIALRRQLYMQKFQLKGERFGGGGGFFGRGRRGGFRGGLSRQGDTCYKCGGAGHWAIDCRGRAAPPPPTTEDTPAEEEPFELPTLEQVARATGTLGPQPLVGSPGFTEDPQKESNNSDKDKDEQLLNVIRPDYERPAAPPAMDPLYPLRDDGGVQETPDEVHAALRELGYPSFRPGQEEAIMRILSGLSTLVVLSTGMGKSLCYQLPAYLYAQRSKCITLVISPLVSLMDDQLSGLPVKLKAACIHSNMSMKQREAAIEKLKSGQVCVLLLSPEALVGGGGSGTGCLPSAQELPPVAFACVDEAHCVSEWSHNFRPCYLRLCKVLRERLGVQCLLGLTATATLSTALDIAQHLDITDQNGIAVRSAAVPPNLNLSVSMDREKDQALVSLLKGDRFGCLDSIIVYCTRREETGRVAALLRTCLQGVLVKENKHISRDSETLSSSAGQRKKDLARKKIRKPLKWQAESYHAGLSGSERRRVQNNFMCGELRIVVATVAFGMGLDKSDVRGIVHYNMPKSFESYVQEIGRAGRDGEPAHCHLFLDPEGGDLHELRRHIYADTVDYYTVKRLVQKVFPACKCKQIHQKQQKLIDNMEDSELLEMMDAHDRDGGVDPPTATDSNQEGEITASPVKVSEGCHQEDERSAGLQCEESCDWPRERVCHTHERAIPIQQTVETLDITEEGVETLLCYLELHPQRFVELLHTTLSVCKVSCYDGPRQLQKITKICPPVAVVLARRRMAGERVESCDQLEFDVVEVADTMGWQLPLVKRGLRQLQWSTERSGGRSGILVEFSSPSFYFRSYGDLSDEEMDRVCHFLHSRVQKQERTQLYQLTACFKAFKSVAFQTVSSCVEDLDNSRSLQLKTLLSEYFDKRRDGDHALSLLDLEELDKFKLLDWEGQIRADVRNFLSTRSDEKFSGRAVARILHGIDGPVSPVSGTFILGVTG
ncbi:ATP-dependent DNA helicase Q4 isoform X2 [Gouania willdenowi]|uniref:ATP-dependent DNA helicase Q4 isoform X2 n=1 Tax=Gouania willdenowi TaxID=441366 RepID=UPI001055FF5F|nr:ATP-dependent DNA helicase Q4 isoform X2 [Gouania willdenowi]